MWEIQNFGWSQRGEMRLVWGLETKLVEMRAERNLGAGRIWSRSGVWERKTEFGARIEQDGKTQGRSGV